MPQFARIKLTSTNLSNLEQVCKEIKEITDKTGIKVRGPLPLPTKRLKVVTRKAPSGQGTHTFDKWEMRIHRRLIDLDADDRTMRQLMRLRVPDDVFIEVNLSTK
ncbi:MAG: 30S ribosomal protein S10 [archaeon]|nr:30S ribosomal protein S10 [archaeon]MCP8314336.1 30S ribosomal protein S10 [archaeon]MCP8316257.1 30S ribosomal protein S10 [archaeon]